METKPSIDYEKVLRDSGMPTTEADISSAFAKVVDEAGLVTNTSRMSPFWRLVNTLVTRPVLWLKEALINVTLKNMYLATASGSWLDMFAWGVNLKRKQATAAQGVIRFYKAAGASAVTVPAGTVIQTERLNGEVYRVSTTESGVIAEGVSHALLPVAAESAGG
ncbi:baseplate J/gp47 family protein, partial [Xenorhabdus sp. Vera]|uniref:baseplate J/gp47 family protein n=1 Tax=Xenorhabdus koppenhoeferi TaxID=351659 RepID=UPI0019AAAE75